MKTLYNFSRSLSTKRVRNCERYMCEDDSRYRIEQQYKTLDHKTLIFALYSLEHVIGSLSEKDKMNRGKIQSLVLELDGICMSLSKFQDCGKGVDMLYEDMYELLAKSTTKIQ